MRRHCPVYVRTVEAVASSQPCGSRVGTDATAANGWPHRDSICRGRQGLFAKDGVPFIGYPRSGKKETRMSAPEAYPQQPAMRQPSVQQYPPAPMPVPAAPQKPKKQRRYVRVWWPVSIGMVISDVIGGLFVLVCFAAAGDQSQTADFEQVAGRRRNSGSVIDADSEYLNIDFDYEGESRKTPGQKAFNCVVDELDMPNSVRSRISKTAQGRLTACDRIPGMEPEF